MVLGLCPARARLPAAAALALALVALVVVSPAHAASLTVTTTADELNSDGDCSLREAIQAANTDASVDACAAGGGADTISVPTGTYSLSIAGAGEDANASGDLDIFTDLAITGGGAATTVVDAGGLDRVFHVVMGATVMSDLTVRGGGGAANLCEGGGVFNLGTLTVSRATIEGNAAGAGGGVRNAGTMTLDHATVRDNLSVHRGGGIDNGGTMIVDNSVVSGNNSPRPPNNATFPCTNLALFGAGGFFNDGTLTIRESAVSSNRAGIHAGGGILNWGSLFVDRSTLSGNSSDDRGGGIESQGTATFVNSTISGNSAVTEGGGVSTKAGTLTLDNSTVSGNATFFGAGGIDSSLGGTVNLGQTIVANSSSGNDCAGTITSTGFNLIGNPGGCVVVGDITTNITGVDPLLDPLADNGGPTFTHALLEGSPAIDAGSPSCPPPGTDQRGVRRSGRCDIGAFEVAAETPEELILGVLSQLQDDVESDNVALADKAEDVANKLLAALAEFGKTPPDGGAALGNLEGAVGDLEAMVNDGLLDPVEGHDLMNMLAGAGMLAAQQAIDAAIGRGGDPAKIAEAEQALATGDALRADERFKEALSNYKEALSKAASS